MPTNEVVETRRRGCRARLAETERRRCHAGLAETGKYEGAVCNQSHANISGIIDVNQVNIAKLNVGLYEAQMTVSRTLCGTYEVGNNYRVGNYAWLLVEFV